MDERLAASIGSIWLPLSPIRHQTERGWRNSLSIFTFPLSANNGRHHVARSQAVTARLPLLPAMSFPEKQLILIALFFSRHGAPITSN